ncbi:MAG: Sec-independent protein translocase subunit TatC, partial [Plesiomonas sp.]
LTPPDVFSQTLLAIPMCLLFELGVFCSRFYVRETVDDDMQRDSEDDDTEARH